MKRRMGSRWRHPFVRPWKTWSAHRIAANVAAVVLVLALVAPVVLMVVGTQRTSLEVEVQGLRWLPTRLWRLNFDTALALVPLRDMLLRSVVIGAVAVPLTVLIASLAGYAIAASRGRHQRVLIGLAVGWMLVPPSLLWLPRFLTWRWLGVLDGPIPLVAPALVATSPIMVLLCAYASSRVAPAIYEAARVEGLGEFGIWRRVAVPLTRPALVATASLAFIAHWSNFADALLYVSSREQQTIAVGMRALAALDQGEYPVVLAGATLATIPPLIVFVFAERSLFQRVF